MALKPEDEQLFWTLANDPATRKEMLEKAEKLGLKEHPAIQDNRHFQDRLDAEVRPLLVRLEETEKKLKAREEEELHFRTLSEIRRPPYSFSDEKLKKLQERMREPGQPVFQSYVQAAEYYRLLDNPIQTSSSPLFALGAPVSNGEDEESDWRKDMESNDKNVNPAMMSKRQRHNYASAKWKKASEDLAREIAGSSRY